MNAPSEPRRYGIRFQWAGGSTTTFAVEVPEGAWLAEYDPDTDRIRWTTDPAQAMTFAGGAEALACYRQQSLTVPLRPDGRPNRPLTAYTVSIERLP